MALGPGDTVWIPCDVASSAFPDERKVSIESPAGPTIVSAAHGKVAARLPGQTRHHQYMTVTGT
jgi:hypothetical protein